MIKLHTNKLRGFIAKVISESQSTFVKDDHILDDILMTFYKKRKRKVILFKVHFEKAYNSIDWSYLKFVMVTKSEENVYSIKATLHLFELVY